jgi:hypothetical protein
MDQTTFVFALVPPAIAVVTSLFASVSDAYIERASREATRDFTRAKITTEIRSAIRDLVVQVARGGLLIANLIATAFSVGTGLFGAIYFLPRNYLIIFIAIAACAVFILYLITIMVRFGVTELYVQKVRRLHPQPGGPVTRALTYGEFIDRALIALNMVLMIVVVAVFLTSPKA